MKNLRSLLIFVIGIGLATIPAIAHHSLAAEYDPNLPIKLPGTVEAGQRDQNFSGRWKIGPLRCVHGREYSHKIGSYNRTWTLGGEVALEATLPDV